MYTLSPLPIIFKWNPRWSFVVFSDQEQGKASAHANIYFYTFFLFLLNLQLYQDRFQNAHV